VLQCVAVCCSAVVEIDKDRPSERDRHTETDTQRQTHERDRHAETDTQRQTHTYTTILEERETHTQRQTQETQRHTETRTRHMQR